MPLELRWRLSGPLRPFWYGRYEVNGKRYCPNLGVKIAGRPPASMSLTEGREDFRRALQKVMPKLLTNGQKSPKDEMRELVEQMSAKNWKKHRERLTALMDQSVA